MNWYDCGQRMYDVTLGRFHRVDRFSEKYYALNPYQYGANNPIVLIDVSGDSLDISGILKDSDLARIFRSFAETDLGRKYLGQFAAKGDKLFDYTFTESGRYNDAGIDLSYTAEDLGKTTRTGDFAPNGTRDAAIVNKGKDDQRLKINVKINSSLNIRTNDAAKGYANARLSQIMDEGSKMGHAHLDNTRLLY